MSDTTSQRGNTSVGFGRRVAQRTYSGVWIVLRDWFRVPKEPPTLPKPPSGELVSFQPSEGFLKYLSLQFWIFLLALDGAILIAWIVLTIAMPFVGLALAIPALILAAVPDILAYVALHLRYDTTWYVMSDRSIRIRRGIWILQEVTITFENIQNVSVAQGPIQRYFGIADVTIQTAGGGGMGPHGTPMGGHHGMIEGIDHADQLRDLLMAKVKASRHAGLGDERRQAVPSVAVTAKADGWSAEHLAMLRSIRDVARRLAEGDRPTDTNVSSP
jgi:membrane protein YdbS with pleckstrin-like domain